MLLLIIHIDRQVIKNTRMDSMLREVKVRDEFETIVTTSILDCKLNSYL
jgi:hypothetical protein